MWKRRQKVWKSKKKVDWSPPAVQVKYPQFTYVKSVDNGKFYLLLDKTKKEFVSTEAFNSWGIKPLLTSTIAISGYYLYGKKGFRTGALIRSIFDQKLYLVGTEQLHPVKTTDIFDVLGYSKDDIYVVSESVIEFYEKGEDINGFGV